jgi:Type I phosphodiesterase / nucleotide pyrophosphatase
MKTRNLAFVAATITLVTYTQPIAAQTTTVGSGTIKHVLLLSIDGMHAVDFYNCANGIAGVNSGNPYCPNLAALGQTGINYVGTISSTPSDSFPGIAALVTGGSPKTTGIYYDVAYDRSLAPPTITTGTGLAGGTCTPYAAAPGTTTDFDQGVALDDTKLNGGAPGAALTEGGIASLDPKKLVRDPANGCAPVYPWNFVRVNTIFGVVHAAGGYTAWIDKHPSYSMVAGPGGSGLDDYYSPEVDSNVVGLPGIATPQGVSCVTVPDSTADLTSWTNSFQNIQCYDALRVQGLLYQISGKTHNGAGAQVPAVFGMNFQSVYIGQSINEPTVGVGGYQNAAGLPTKYLLGQIQFVDSEIGLIVGALQSAGLYDNTLLIITAKHGESPIDPTQYVANCSSTPATLLGTAIPTSESPLTAGGIGATEDDVSVLWLAPGASVTSAVTLLQTNASAIGLGEIFYGPSLALNFNIGGLGAGQDPRSPDILVIPNVGMTYSGSTTMIGDHGGFGHDDTNVIMLVSNPNFSPQTYAATVRTAQVAPTILQALGLEPTALDAVRAEGTLPLPGVQAQITLGSPVSAGGDPASLARRSGKSR